MFTHDNYDNISYELYKELSDELCDPIVENNMPLELKFELYQSKLIYLYNLNEQCFRSVNVKENKSQKNYTTDDLIKIQKAIEFTKNYIKETIEESLKNSFSIAHQKGFLKNNE